MGGLADYRNRSRGQGASSESRAVERAMQAAGVELGQGELQQAQQQTIVRRLVAGDPSARTAFANNLTELTDDPAEYERAIAALEEAEAQAPGVKMDVLSQVGSAKNPQLVEYATQYLKQQEAEQAAAAEASAKEEAAAAGVEYQKPRAVARPRTEKPFYQDLALFGAGGDTRQKVRDETGKRVHLRDESGKIVGQETPSLAKLVGRPLRKETKAEQSKRDSNWQMLEFSAQPELYRKIAGEQRAQLTQTPLSPEHVALLSDKQVADLKANSREELIGRTLNDEEAYVLSRSQIGQILGVNQPRLSELTPEEAARLGSAVGGGTPGSEAYMDTTYGDAFMRRIAMLADMQRRGVHIKEPLAMGDRHLTAFYKYPFWTSVGGELKQPELAPSGEFVANLLAPLLDPEGNNSTFIPDASAVFDEAIRRDAAMPPREDTYLKTQGMSERDFAMLRLPPGRKGKGKPGQVLIDAERAGAWPFPQFMEGVWINRGQPRPELNLGGLLLDRESLGAGSAAPATISTPDGMQQETAAPPPEPPPPTPSGDEVSMYGRRPLERELLAALLA